ncbi:MULTISPECIES: Uma2 family endonuclease [Fischerella]|uniref:Uma2 family endonuclease n=1 Tax=Fischerella muscicola CCMEE 5323 TaxID=2019572 RepID=A0A2N6K7W4_FISMU|nr:MULTISPECIES: Uma2 family endonuclease [Fischerella]MBD2431826.1 Uma2 family endonuclease [Fischerella sp. FACHB-380]PLZ93453.1 Uma2 family endonuclease [Fischerella muscicola CCMEE 5323]
MSEPGTIEVVFNENSDAEVFFPPGDLWSDEPPLESDLHRDQIELLISILKLWWRERQDFYASGNLTVYYSPNQKKSEDFRGPDFFVVLGTEKKDRKSWVVWQEEGKYPNLIIEILSDSTAAVDKGFKKQLYQDTFRTPDYFWFDPVTQELQGFHLVDGKYQEIQPTADGKLWSQQLELYLGVHEGKLRYFTLEQKLIPSAEEIAEQEKLRAQQAEERLQQTEQELSRLREILRAQGIDPENI